METPPDDFGNAIRFGQFVTEEERKNPPDGLYGIVERWQCSTSTYGGDTVTDCCDV